MRLLECSEQEEQDGILNEMNHKLLMASMKERYIVEIRKAKTKAILNVHRKQHMFNQCISINALVESKCNNINSNSIFTDTQTPLIDYHKIVKDSQNYPLDSATLFTMLKNIQDTQFYSKIQDYKTNQNNILLTQNNYMIDLLKLIINSLTYIIRYMNQSPFEERIHLSTPLNTELSLLAKLYIEYPIMNDQTTYHSYYFIISTLSLNVIASLAFTPLDPLQFAIEVSDAVITMCSLSQGSFEIQASSLQALKFLMISSDDVSLYMLKHHNPLNVCQTAITKLIKKINNQPDLPSSIRSILNLDSHIKLQDNKNTLHEAFIHECFEIILHCMKFSNSNLITSNSGISKHTLKESCFIIGCQIINVFNPQVESKITIDSLQLALETMRLCLSDELNNPCQQNLINYISNLNIPQIINILKYPERLSLKSIEHIAQIISIISALDNSPYSQQLFETAIGKGNLNNTLLNLLLKERNLINVKILRSLFNGCVDFPWVIEEIAQSTMFWENILLLAQRSKNNCVIVELLKLIELLSEEYILKDDEDNNQKIFEHINQVTLIGNQISICVQVLSREYLDLEALIIVKSQLINALTVPCEKVKILVLNACERVDLYGIIMSIPYQDERIEIIRQQLIDLLLMDRRNNQEEYHEDWLIYNCKEQVESDWAKHEMIVDFNRIELNSPQATNRND